MLMVVCSNLRRPGHVGAASAARNINWLISGGYTPPIRAVARQYVQAPEARPVPDERYPGSQQDRRISPPRPCGAASPRTCDRLRLHRRPIP
ncbi:GD25814 [Drosophila simulans]|uniref:GD25814 n=1 Tax=Drosophila simulans TaxID=7240 RepID=B4QDG6_DROSI|nr:GD25814 [Drosophila simulans]